MNEVDLKNRIRNAVVILKNNNSFKVGDLTFRAYGKDSFSVTGWTIKDEIKSLTKQDALNELSEIKSLFERMKRVSTELSEFIKHRQVEFNLGYDYGMGGIGICSEIDGQINWEIELT